MRDEANARSPFRTLRAPDGAIPKGSGARTGSNDHDEWYQRIETELSGLEVLRWYANQLEIAGWSLGSELVDTSVALQTARFTDDEGIEWHGLLFTTESATAPGHVVVLIRQTRLVQR